MPTRLAMAALFSIAPFDASAIVRYMVHGMTCAEVQEALDRDGIAILYRQGESGVVLYDRFVKGRIVLPSALHDGEREDSGSRYERVSGEKMRRIAPVWWMIRERG